MGGSIFTFVYFLGHASPTSQKCCGLVMLLFMLVGSGRVSVPGQ